MSIRVEEYIRPDGTNPYQTWFDSLDAQAAAKIVTAKLRMELGHTSSIKWFAGLGEYVIDWGPGYQIYLAKMEMLSSFCSAVARSAASRWISIGPGRCTPNTRPGKVCGKRPARLGNARGDRHGSHSGF